MAWVAIALLLVVVAGFAKAMVEWQRRAELWEHMYRQTDQNLQALLTGVESYLDAQDEGLLRVWKAGSMN